MIHRYAIVLLATSTLVAAPGSVNFRVGANYRAITPSGYNIIELQPSGTTMALMAVVECPEIEGMKQVSEGLNAHVVSTQGVTVYHFPHQFSFRVTASLRKPILQPPDFAIYTEEDPQQFLLRLQFRLKAYNALRMRIIEPQSIIVIGVPTDITYDERVFRIEFDVDSLPVTDRMILETVAPEGETISRFPFGLL